MKMVKSLLLGTAAGFVAIAGAQAADLPVKAKPVQYVKICSLYGAGFYYIPGTDTCIKVGGWVRQYLGWGANGDLTNGALGSGDINTRTSDNGWTFKSRGYITADARTQTEYGTLRGYFDIGESTANGVATVASSNRAFIQLAGFTLGITQSFYDIYPTPALSFWGGMANPSSDTGDGGQTVTAYTAQFGGGFSASIAAEAPRNTTVIGPATVLATVGALPITQAQYAVIGTAGAVTYPDGVANLRVDQAWGSAQIMGAVHNASGAYYGASTATGHPGNATGWDIGAGAIIKSPWGPGDYFSFQVNYSEGASGYVNDAAHNMYAMYNGGFGGTYGFGITSDGVYTAGGGVELTTSWGVNAAYEHHWNEKWQTSLYGAYIKTEYDSTANAQLCALEGPMGVTAGAIAAGSCDNDWSYWNVGTRTQFNVDSQTYIGLDVMYTHLNTANGGLVGTVAASGNQPAALRTTDDQSAWMAEFRFHRNFYP